MEIREKCCTGNNRLKLLSERWYFEGEKLFPKWSLAAQLSICILRLYRTVRMAKKKAKVSIVRIKPHEMAGYRKEYMILIGETKESASQGTPKQLDGFETFRNL